MARKRIGEILIDAGLISQSQLQSALIEQRRWGGQLGRIFVDMRMVSEDHLVEALSKQLGLPSVNLDTRPISPEALSLIPGELAEQHSILPFEIAGKFLDVAMANPANLGITDELRIRTQLNVRAHLAGPRMIERAIARHYGRGTGRFSVGFEPGDEISELELETEPITQRPAAASAAANALRTDPAVSGGQSSYQPSLPASPPISSSEQRREIEALQRRISKLEALVSRDEDVLRKLLALLVEKGLASREEILERIK